MNSKSITYIFLAFIAILGWNAFLIQRDQKMFDAYDRQMGVERLKYPPTSSLKTWCEKQANQHPDCNLK